VRLEAPPPPRRALIEVEIVPGRHDQAFLNRQRVVRGADLAAAFQVTVFAPDDLALVKGPPERRRDFLDDLLEASDGRLGYLRRRVERALRQRANLLKQAGGALTAERERVAKTLEPAVGAALDRLAGADLGVLELSYERSYEGCLADALVRARAEDLRRGVSTLGPHRDELVVRVGGLDARTRLSQGRQRALTLALRLAAHDLVTAARGSAPVLLLDDAFSELDDRTARALVTALPPGQAILTTAGPLPTGADPSLVVRLVDGRIRT
jgi:DNA replication and repair protein RecF